MQRGEATRRNATHVLLKLGFLMAQLPASIVLVLHMTQSQLWGGRDTTEGRMALRATSETSPAVTRGGGIRAAMATLLSTIVHGERNDFVRGRTRDALFCYADATIGTDRGVPADRLITEITARTRKLAHSVFGELARSCWQPVQAHSMNHAAQLVKFYHKCCWRREAPAISER